MMKKELLLNKESYIVQLEILDAKQDIVEVKEKVLKFNNILVPSSALGSWMMDNLKDEKSIGDFLKFGGISALIITAISTEFKGVHVIGIKSPFVTCNLEVDKGYVAQFDKELKDENFAIKLLKEIRELEVIYDKDNSERIQTIKIKGM